MSTPREILKRYWGYDHFRPHQEEIVLAILSGNDTLALLPTGGGKSVCFQVPALLLEGICIVVSPLLALMSDQVNNLRKRGIIAHSVSSAMSVKEIDRVLDNCVYGQVKFLYVSPERLKSDLFIQRFKKMKVSMIAVDEAHCISQWGYDFRPPYLDIAAIREFKPGVPVLALTATATPAVVKDIQEKLLFSKPHVIASGFSRTNLAYIVVEEENKEARMLDICSRLKGSGIVYCGTRLRTKEVAELLRRKKISSGYYHAGLSTEERDKAYKAWMKNETRIICATNAFGMGIDKPDVRFVVHADVPPNPESYFQEAGRAGRDGKQAYAVLLWHISDIERLSEQLRQKYPDKGFIEKVYTALCDHFQLAIGAGKDTIYPVDITAFCTKNNFRYIEVIYAIRLLELSGYLSLNEAVWMPSRLSFNVNKQELYSFQVGNPSLDPIIKTLLRMYGGLFDQYVAIKEKDIATSLHINVQEVKEKLKLLRIQGIAGYEEQQEQPQVTMLTARIRQGNMTIPPEVYEERKKIETERMKTMRRYLEKKRCRNLMLLEYFGEKKNNPCGQCDICRSTRERGFLPADAERMNEALMELAIKGSVSLEQLPVILPQFNREQLIGYVRWKIDTGELALDDRMRIVMPGL
ncbi:MAG: RecQ family ATP-dependent DNA helicase [Crocinitomicaceae bacterium]|nr:RecQ family ATP-dependent DNA helicase [Crocinitomicaceae bacterium]